MPMLFLNNDDVHELLDMKTCLEALEVGYQDLAVGNAVHRPRLDVWAPSDEQDAFFRWGSMEGVCRTYGTFAIRMKSDMVRWPEGANEEKYCIEPGTFCGLVMLFSTNNGEPLAIINDGVIQHMRVGGGAGLGVKYLAREDAEVVGIIGSGGMARTYLQAFAEVRNLKRVKVYSRSRERREAYAAEMRGRLDIRVDVLDNPEDVVRGSDIVSTCTDAMRPVFNCEWLEPGMHVTNLGGYELDEAVFDKANVIIRQGIGGARLEEDARIQYGRGHSPVAFVAGTEEEMKRLPPAGRRMQQFGSGSALPSFTDLVNSAVSGRTSRDDITLYLNGGNQGLQFAAVGKVVYDKAREMGLGHEMPTGMFLQDIRD
jgi:alanine dehydrogenase